MKNFKTVNVNVEQRKITVLFDEKGSNIPQAQLAKLKEIEEVLSNAVTGDNFTINENQVTATGDNFRTNSAMPSTVTGDNF